MSAGSDTLNKLGWSRHEVLRHMDALPLVDDEPTDGPRSARFHRMHWISAAIALTLFVLARLDLLPAMPW